MKNRSGGIKSSIFVRIRIIIGTLMAVTGTVMFTLAAMLNLIEPTTVNIIISLALFAGGLLLANSMKVIEFVQDIMLR